MFTNEARVLACVVMLLGETYSSIFSRKAFESVNFEVKKENSSKLENRQGYPGLGSLNYGANFGNFGPAALLPGEMGFMDVDGFEGIIEPGKSTGLTGIVKSVVKTQKKRIEEIKKIAKQTKTMIQNQFKLIKKKPVAEEPIPVLTAPYIPAPLVPFSPFPSSIPLDPLPSSIPFNTVPSPTFGFPPPPVYGPAPSTYGQGTQPKGPPSITY